MPQMGKLGRRLGTSLFLLFIALAPLFPALFLGRAFLPADQLQQIAPWSALPSATFGETLPWNVLRLDGILQFYPWRLEVARQIRQGQVPLWNPYQFAADGGTPLLANSQSAPLYPLNWIYSLLPPNIFWYAFGLTAALHLLIAATGMFALLRSLGSSRIGACLAAITWCWSGPVVTWLSLPTFLSVVCWLPGLLFFLHRTLNPAVTRRQRQYAGLAAVCTGGLSLLGGHLQIAFYVLLTALLFLLFQLLARRSLFSRKNTGTIIGIVVLAGVALFALAAPQILPSLELSRLSHRHQDGAPDWAAYQAYNSTHFPLRNLVTFLVPDFFGHPNTNVYWNTNNYAEWAVYAGILPLLLALFALLVRSRHDTALPDVGSSSFSTLLWHRVFFAVLALLALLMASGSVINIVFFFGVPGFAQTGSPARVLVIAVFALAALTGIGADTLLRSVNAARPDAARSDAERPDAARRDLVRTLVLAAAAAVFLGAIGASQAAAFAERSLSQIPFGDLIAVALPGILTALVLVIAACGLLIGIANFPASPAGARRVVLAILLIGMTASDLWWFGSGYNPMPPARAVYPETVGLRWLQEHAAADTRIAVINPRWSISSEPPAGAVLPPNTATVFHLHDLAGYDSLFPRRNRERVLRAASGQDPAPPENGNIVFIKQVPTAVALGARYLLTAPAQPIRDDVQKIYALRAVYRGTDLIVYENTGATLPFARADAPENSFTAFRIGLFSNLISLAGLLGVAVAGVRWPRTQPRLSPVNLLRWRWLRRILASRSPAGPPRRSHRKTARNSGA